MLNCESTPSLPLTRRQALRIGTGTTLSLLFLSSRPALANELSRPREVTSTNLNESRTSLINNMNQRFGIVFPEANIVSSNDIYLYANFYRALTMYEAVGITNFSNNHSGNLHFVVNNEGKTLAGKDPYPNAIAYYWNDGVPQTVFRWPQDGFPQDWWQPQSNGNKPTSLESFYNDRATVYALHELFHPLQFRNIPPSTDFNQSKVLLTPDMQDFAQTVGVAITSSEAEINTKPPWEINYQYQDREPWADNLRQYDWRLGRLPNLVVEGSAVSMSQFLWNKDLFKDRFPDHARWAEVEIERLKAA